MKEKSFLISNQYQRVVLLTLWWKRVSDKQIENEIKWKYNDGEGWNKMIKMYFLLNFPREESEQESKLNLTI